MEQRRSADLHSLGPRFEIEKKLGAGGMGEVYKARDCDLNKLVAMKVLLLNQSPELAMRFQVEAKATAKLNHPNIVKVLDFGQTPAGDMYLTMDYIEGDSLDSLVDEQHHVTLEKALPLFLQICDGLSHAHSHGVLHRDVKPSNIMLKRNNDLLQAVIVDFGLAKLETNEQALTGANVRIGSPCYMSPEHVRGDAIDGRSDLYSMGCLMYRVLTGVVPLAGDTYLETVVKQIEEVPKPINEVSEGLSFPKEMEDIVAKALEKDPENRFQSIDELVHALLQVEEIIESLKEEQGQQPATVSGARPGRTEIRLSPLLAAIAAGVIIVVGGGIFFLSGRFGQHQARVSQVDDEFLFPKSFSEKPQEVNGYRKYPTRGDYEGYLNATFKAHYDAISKKKQDKENPEALEQIREQTPYRTALKHMEDADFSVIKFPRKASDAEEIRALWIHPVSKKWLLEARRLWDDPERAELLSQPEVREFLTLPANWIGWSGTKKRFAQQNKIKTLMADPLFLSMARNPEFQRLMYNKKFREYVCDPQFWVVSNDANKLNMESLIKLEDEQK